jgi:hypothetical protein
VVGAGLAGLASAGALRAEGWAVTVVDKGRGVGGRTATRREGAWRFDHGAARLELGAPELACARATWEEAGAIARWSPRGRAAGGAAAVTAPTWVGVPTASALAGHLASGLDVRTGAEVIRIVRAARWWLEWGGAGGAAARLGPFDRVIVTAPAPQAVALIRTAGPAAAGLAETLAAARYAPCLAAMAILEARTALDELAFGAGALAAAHRMDDRPGRPRGAVGTEAWVLHGSEVFSATKLEVDPHESARVLVAELAQHIPGRLVAVRGHRWRYARAVVRVPAPCAYDPALGLGAAGDAFEAGAGAPAASRAVLSGLALAAEVARSAPPR